MHKEIEQKFFEVEKVIDKRFVKGRPEYKVKWKGYSEGESTWETAGNLSSIYELILVYQNKLLSKNEDDSENNATVVYSQNQEQGPEKWKMIEFDQMDQSKGSFMEISYFEPEKTQPNTQQKSKEKGRKRMDECQSSNQKLARIQSKKIENELKNAQKPKSQPSTHLVYRNSKRSQLQAKIESKKEERLKKREQKKRIDQKREQKKIIDEKGEQKKRKSSLKKPEKKIDPPHREQYITVESKTLSKRMQSKSEIIPIDKPSTSNYYENDYAPKTQNKSTKIPSKAEPKIIIQDRQQDNDADIELNQIRQLENVGGKLTEYLIEYNSGTLKVLKMIDLMKAHPIRFAEYLEKKNKI